MKMQLFILVDGYVPGRNLYILIFFKDGGVYYLFFRGLFWFRVGGPISNEDSLTIFGSLLLCLSQLRSVLCELYGKLLHTE